MKEVANLMQIQMDNFDSWDGNNNTDTLSQASKLFNIEYKPKESGIYGDEK